MIHVVMAMEIPRIVTLQPMLGDPAPILSIHEILSSCPVLDSSLSTQCISDGLGVMPDHTSIVGCIAIGGAEGVGVEFAADL